MPTPSNRATESPASPTSPPATEDRDILANPGARSGLRRNDNDRVGLSGGSEHTHNSLGLVAPIALLAALALAGLAPASAVLSAVDQAPPPPSLAAPPSADEWELLSSFETDWPKLMLARSPRELRQLLDDLGRLYLARGQWPRWMKQLGRLRRAAHSLGALAERQSGTALRPAQQQLDVALAHWALELARAGDFDGAWRSLEDELAARPQSPDLLAACAVLLLGDADTGDSLRLAEQAQGADCLRSLARIEPDYTALGLDAAIIAAEVQRLGPEVEEPTPLPPWLPELGRGAQFGQVLSHDASLRAIRARLTRALGLAERASSLARSVPR